MSMEARLSSYLILSLLTLLTAQTSLGGEPSRVNYRSKNFLVTAHNRELATQIGFAAEKYRRELAMEWLNQELPDWERPCSISAIPGPQVCGETHITFAGSDGPFNFVMTIRGNRERMVDSVLPHEITHTIFATHFNRPLPRWADEGACTTVEHISERRANHRVLIDTLTTGKGIPFNQMFGMKNYPHDLLPLYAQGYSLSRFLIQRGGKRKFVKFIESGLPSSDWNRAIADCYQIRDLSELQVTWLQWVKNGCPKPESPPVLVGTPIPALPVGLPTTSNSEFDLVGQRNDTTDLPPETTADSEKTNPAESFYLQEIRRVKSESPGSTIQAPPTDYSIQSRLNSQTYLR